MRKKVLIIMPSMFIGGAERSLLGLLDSFDYDKYDISLFLYRHEGEFLQFINENVRILPAIPEYGTFDVPIKSLIFSKKWKFGFVRLRSKLEQKLHAKTHPDENGAWMHMQKISKCLQKHLPKIPGEYDLGIMFLGVPDTLVNKVNTTVKIAWNHTDYTTLGPDRMYDQEFFRKLNYVVSVSEKSKNQFLEVYPEMKDKALVIENILSKSFIIEQSKDNTPDMVKSSNEIIILSVGRYSYAKNFDNVPEITSKLNQRGLNVKWYLIGYGGDEPLIRQRIREYNMEQNVVLLGKKLNPYPYIKNCDIYVQPSRFEGKSVTVREAQILGKPVIITNYASADSQIKDGIDGIIVPMDNEGCAEGIYQSLGNKALLEEISENCQNRDYTNKEEITKIYDLFE